MAHEPTSSEDPIPYDELDPPIVPLVALVNEFPGLRTFSSCGGHEEPTTPASWPADQWYVDFHLAPEDPGALVAVPTADAWVSLEFLTWAINHYLRKKRAIELWPDASPPYLNFPGRMVAFRISGFRDDDDGMEPHELVDEVRQCLAEELFVPASSLIHRAQGGPGGPSPGEDW